MLLFKENIVFFTLTDRASTIPSNMLLLLFKKNLNASKPSEHPPQVEECLKVYKLGGNIGCRDKTSSWYQKGSPM